MKNPKKILLLIISLLFLLPLTMRANPISPTGANPISPTFGEKFNAYLFVFLVDLILNFLIFGLGYLIFLRKNINIFKWGRFLLSLLMISIWGFIVDAIVLSNLKVFQVQIWNFIYIFIPILIVDTLICKFYLKSNLRKSVYVGLWMGILSNPIVFSLLVDLLF